jgi:hypothetical protein
VAELQITQLAAEELSLHSLRGRKAISGSSRRRRLRAFGVPSYRQPTSRLSTARTTDASQR